MKETCKRGHDLAQTAYVSPQGKRQCAECVKVRRTERAIEKRASIDVHTETNPQ